jgi:ribulose-phosphate 3-epimerase
MVLIAPSLLSADFTRLADEVRLIEDAGADVVHVDVMDGHFVPNLTVGPRVVELLKAKTSLPLDVHLMVDRPDEVIPWFLDAGADWISIHAEASRHLHRDVSAIRTAGRKAGVALNPATPLVALQEILRDLDYVLLMCVNPGRGSQPFIEASHDKIRTLRRWRADLGIDRPWIEIDGGVSLANVPSLVRNGAEIFVAGNAVFNAPDPAEAVRRMKAAAGEADAR